MTTILRLDYLRFRDPRTLAVAISRDAPLSVRCYWIRSPRRGTRVRRLREAILERQEAGRE